MTATVTDLSARRAAAESAQLGELALAARRVDAAHRLLARRRRKLDVRFCNGEGTPLPCAPAESSAEQIIVTAAAWPENGGDVLIGTAGPLPRAAFDSPAGTLNATLAAIGDLLTHVILHPTETGAVT